MLALKGPSPYFTLKIIATLHDKLSILPNPPNPNLIMKSAANDDTFNIMYA